MIRMDNLDQLTMSEMEELVSSNRHVSFVAVDNQAIYGFLERVLQRQQYRKLKKAQRGIVRRFLCKVTGFSRTQLTRLIQRWMEERKIVRRLAPRPHFPVRYTKADIEALAEVDEAHQQPAGPGVRHLCKRAWENYADKRFERLAEISVSHIYNLRKSETYCRIRVFVQHTQGRQVAIAERRLPDPKGAPGYLRVDTVHQGHQDGKPGLFHINSVDTVTQWEVLGCVQTICERDLIPVLEAMLHQYPFVIKGFHCDNGSEFINKNVVNLLNKLLVGEFTKSRAYRTTDNALVEGKNGAVIRKLIGYGAIGAEHAEKLQAFYMAYLNPYLSYHRPCGFATIETNERGQRKRRYRHQDYRTPYEKLTSLPDWEKHLKPGVSKQILQQQADSRTDTESARRMQKAKVTLLQQCRASR